MFCHFFFNPKLIFLIALSAFQGSLNAPASSGPRSIFVDGLGDESTSSSVDQRRGQHMSAAPPALAIGC